ncbi:SUKH-4 family immunity protein [Variovorax paradoxus]|uniref:SUKH-4 family immunity protein n=1 Tax=Variovorax paradoxus TaxID=34073 RepID=UPI0029C679DB|nr:SUKH-4 family immunity protein [Variovorax paradoxus]
MTHLEYSPTVIAWINADRAHLTSLGIAPETARYLEEKGLPVFGDDPPFGIRFEEIKAISLNNRSYLLLGREIWKDDLLIALDPSDMGVYAVSPGAKPSYMNASVESLTVFVYTVYDLMRRAAASEPDPAPAVMNLQQMQEKLALLRQGLLRPPKVQVRFNRAAEAKKVKDTLKQIDAKALKGTAWWKVVLDEFEDGLI